jgi:hypothetical protein
MDAFQWNKSDIDWFISKFKGEEKEIDARSVQRKYNNKPSSSDFRRLMRLVVQSGYARVTNGCVTSKKYRIRMNSEQYPCRIYLFDKELIEHTELDNIVPEFDDLMDTFFPEIKEYNPHQVSIWDDHRLLAEMIVAGFSTYNYQYSDYDFIWESELAVDLMPSDSYKDLFCGIMNALVAEYIACKVVIPEIRNIAATTGEMIPEMDINDIFIGIISAAVTLSVLKHIKELTFPFSSEISNRTRSNTLKEFIDAAIQRVPLTDKEISKVFISSLSHKSEYIELIENASLLWLLGATESLSKESLDALNKVNETYTQVALFMAGSFLMT